MLKVLGLFWLKWTKQEKSWLIIGQGNPGFSAVCDLNATSHHYAMLWTLLLFAFIHKKFYLIQIYIQHFQLVLQVQAVLGVAPVSTECCWKWAYLGIQPSLHKQQWCRQAVTWTWSTWRRCSRGAAGDSRRAPPPPSRTPWPGPLLRRPRYWDYFIL